MNSLPTDRFVLSIAQVSFSLKMIMQLPGSFHGRFLFEHVTMHCVVSPTKHSFIHRARQPCWVALWTQWSQYNFFIQWRNANFFLWYLQRWRNLRVIPCYMISHGVWHVAVPPQNAIPPFSLLWCQDQFWSQPASCTMALSVKVLEN
jgi:hypothetical protein